MLDQLRQETHSRRRGASTVEYSLLLAAIATVVALVAFAFGSYLHSALRPSCTGTAGQQAAAASCAAPQTGH
jgi:Flp pilus assembly pilin Flp